MFGGRPQPHESIEYARREGRKLIERWNNRLRLDDPRFVERYVEGNLLLHLHVVAGPDSEKLCAVLKRDDSSIPECCEARSHDPHSPARNRAVRQWIARGTVDPQRMKHDGTADDIQGAMLIDSIKVVQPIEGGGLRALASLVRLQRLDECLGSGGRSLYFSSTAGFIFVRSLADWEAGIPIPSLPVRQNQLPDNMIKRASEIMDNLADQYAKPYGGIFLDETTDHSVEFSRGTIRIWLTRESIGIESQKGLDFIVEVTDLLYGPFGLRPNAV